MKQLHIHLQIAFTVNIPDDLDIKTKLALPFAVASMPKEIKIEETVGESTALLQDFIDLCTEDEKKRAMGYQLLEKFKDSYFGFHLVQQNKIF